MTSKKENIKHKKPWWKRILKISFWLFISLFILTIGVILFIRSPWGQNIIVNKATSYISDKTNTKVSIKKLFVTFTGDIELLDLYLEDKNQDTLVYSKQLIVEIPLWPIIKGNPVSVDNLQWNNVTVNIVREDSIRGFNYQFLIDAFATDTLEKKEKEEDSNPLAIYIGSVDLKNFRLKFIDELNGSDARLKLGDLHLQGKSFDLEKMDIRLAEIALSNTQINYSQYKSQAVNTDDTSNSSNLLPFLNMNNFILDNVNVNYNSIPDSIEAKLNLNTLSLQIPKVDLNNQNIDISNLALNNSTIKFKSYKKSLPTVETEKQPATPLQFNWPKWKFNVDKIALTHNNINYQTEDDKTSIGNEFNPNHLILSDFNFLANNIKLTPEEALKINLVNISFNEQSGLDLKQLGFNIAATPTLLSVNQFVLKTNNSSINSDLGVQYLSINQVINAPETAPINLKSLYFSIDLNDVLSIKPDLNQNEYFKVLAEKQINGKIKAQGKLTKIKLPYFNVKWGDKTQINTNGEFLNLLDVNKLNANIENFTFNSNKADLAKFIPDTNQFIPKNIKLQSSINGSLNDIKGKANLTIPEGKINIIGDYSNKADVAFNTTLKILDLNVSNIINDPKIGNITAEITAKGNGSSLNKLNAQLASNFKQLTYNRYDFSALELDGDIKKGNGDLNINFKDKNLDLAIQSDIKLDSVKPKIDLDFNLEGADFNALGLTDKKLRAKLMMDASFIGTIDSFNFESHFTEGVAVYDEGNHYLGPINLFAKVKSDSSTVDVNSNFLNGHLNANAGITAITSSITNHFNHYFNDSIKKIDTVNPPVLLELQMSLSDNDLITDFLVPEIRTFDTIQLTIDYNQIEDKLISNLNLPYLDYNGNSVDSLKLNIAALEKQAKFKFGFNQLEANPLMMSQTHFDGEFENGLLDLHFNALNGEQKLYVIESQVKGKSSDFTFHVQPEGLIINTKEWSIPNDNSITVNDKIISTNNFIISRNQQSIAIKDDLKNIAANNIGLAFKNFKFSNILALLNKDNLLAKGNLEGDIVAVSPFNELGLLADFRINKLVAFSAPLGDLSLKAKAKTSKDYLIDLKLKGDDIDIVANGDYNLNNIGSELDFNLDLNKIAMKTIDSISGQTLDDVSGYVSGEMDIDGGLSNPNYKGFLQFNDAIFKVNKLNTSFKLKNDKISVTNEAITFKKFSIQDKSNDALTVDGEILTKDISDPIFNLKINSNSFQAMNSTEKDNKLFYGNLNFDIDGVFTGNMNSPVINASIGINKPTDFTYVLPASEAQLVSKDGLIEFVNKEDPDNILTRSSDSNNQVVFAGIELHTKLKINKEAEFNIIVDPQTGDKLTVSGAGNLKFNIEKNGLTTMSGRYDIFDGKYSLSLYNLVKREFNFESGSSIAWRGGSPTDADLNITARYKVKTSASGLMATQISGLGDDAKNKYRQKLPFLVYLNVKGSINNPELSFNLGMPEDSRGAIDGTVYSRIKQLNSEEDELNKQVFSLLVLERFYPNAGSDGSNGGAASLVRTNINDALTDQLNAFSGKLTGNTGIELDFGLNSYTDYQGESTQQRTDLNITAQKKLFDERLILEVGSDVSVEGSENPGEGNPVVGNVSIQYLLTKDGHWRLKGFRNSTFENAIDGQVFVNGISLIFKREFNGLSDLLKNRESKNENQEKTDTKTNKE